MDLSLTVTDLSQPADLSQLKRAISTLADETDQLYTTTAPNGNISARIGRIAVYDNSGTITYWANTDGAKTWIQIDQGAFFKQGDLIQSTVTTARTGWTNVSATYSNKFMRINATPGSTGGADTHAHAAGTYTVPAHDHGAVTGGHTLTLSEIPAHTHDVDTRASGGAATVIANTTGSGGTTISGAALSNGGPGSHSHTITQQAAASITGNSDTVSNVPAYFTVALFQKD